MYSFINLTLGFAGNALLARFIVNYFMPNFLFLPVVALMSTVPLVLTISTIAAVVLFEVAAKFILKHHPDTLLGPVGYDKEAAADIVKTFTPTRLALEATAGIGLVAAGAAFAPGFAAALNSSVLSFNLIKTSAVAAAGVVAGDVVYNNLPSRSAGPGI